LQSKNCGSIVFAERINRPAARAALKRPACIAMAPANVWALQAVVYAMNTACGSSAAHSPVVCFETGGCQGRKGVLSDSHPLEKKRHEGAVRGRAPAGTSADLRVGVAEPGIKLDGDILVEYRTGPMHSNRRVRGSSLLGRQIIANATTTKLAHSNVNAGISWHISPSGRPLARCPPPTSHCPPQTRRLSTAYGQSPTVKLAPFREELSFCARNLVFQ
jgi:hypothetical protein